MKTILFYISLCIGIQQTAFSEEIISGELKKCALIISSTQAKSEGATYTDLRDNQIYKVSFPKENFNVLFSSKLGYKAIYKSWGNKEILAVTEGIDFSKALKLERVISPGNTNALTIRMYFPEGYLKTRIIENGVLKATVSEEFLEFFYPEQDEQTGSELWKSLNILIAFLKETKGVDASTEDIELGRLAALNKDKEKAKVYYQKAIDMGSTYALYMMSFVADGSEREGWIQKAIDKNDTYAMAYEGFRTDPVNTNMLEAAAAKGNTVAMHWLGYTENSKQHYDAQYEWYKKAYKNRATSNSKSIVYDDIISYAIIFEKFDDLAEVLNNTDIYSSGLTKKEILLKKASLLAGQKKGLEAIALLQGFIDAETDNKLLADAYNIIMQIYEKGLGVKKDKKLKEKYKKKYLSAIGY